MQFRGEIETWFLEGGLTRDGYYLPGSYYTKCSMHQAAWNATLGNEGVVVVCHSWRAFHAAKKSFAYEYEKNRIQWDMVIDDRHMAVHSLFGKSTVIVEFVVKEDLEKEQGNASV